MTRFSSPCRSALTKLELLVVLLLAVSFAGIALAFLTSGREASKRVSCTNNLHFIGKAIHAYGDRNKVLDGDGVSHRALPPARIADGYATWAVLILPYLGETKAGDEWDVQKSYFDQSEAARRRVMPIFFCPSRLRDGRLSISGDGRAKEEHLPGALGDYAATAGDGNPKQPWTSPEANGPIIEGEVLEKKDGLILRWRSRTHFDSLKRGTGYTVLVGDKHVRAGTHGKAEFGDGSMYNGRHPASFLRVGGPGVGLAQNPSEPMRNNFGGAHPGFVNFLMADTSVRTTAININEEVLGKMMVRE